MYPKLTDSICIVTGGTRGAGRGIAIELGELGAKVIITGRSLDESYTKNNPETLRQTAEMVQSSGGKCIPFQCDHTSEEEVLALKKYVETTFGKVHLLVNNVWGGYEGYDDTFDDCFWDQPIDRWDKMFNSGVRAHFLTSKHIVPMMMKEKKGLVINTTFWDGGKYFKPLPYNIAKCAVNRLAHCMALELKSYNISVVALSPGWMRTEKIKRQYDVNDFDYKDNQILAKTESTRYIGKAVVALLKDTRNMQKTGNVLYVGNLAREYGFFDIDGTQPERYVASTILE
jgi:NAD(P)-dependent dehydrogenase (short-subunit alcohol dehydrogenase family)